MTNFTATALFILFSIHLVVFLRMTVKYRRFDFLFATITFFMLALSNGLRLWRPNMGLAGYNPHTWLRAIAWSATVAAFIAKFKFKKNKALQLSRSNFDRSAKVHDPQAGVKRSTDSDGAASVPIIQKSDPASVNDPTP